MSEEFMEINELRELFMRAAYDVRPPSAGVEASQGHILERMGLELDRMDEREARVTLLEIIQQRLEEPRQEIEQNPERVLGIDLKIEDFVQAAKVLGWSAAETSVLYKRLVYEGFVRQLDGDTKFLEVDGVVQYAWVEDLTDKGMWSIGVLDPAEELAQALRSAIRDIKDSYDIPEEKKLGLLEWLHRGIVIARTDEGATRMAQTITQYLS